MIEVFLGNIWRTPLFPRLVVFVEHGKETVVVLQVHVWMNGRLTSKSIIALRVLQEYDEEGGIGMPVL